MRFEQQNILSEISSIFLNKSIDLYSTSVFENLKLPQQLTSMVSSWHCIPKVHFSVDVYEVVK